jgi:aryl-alcohol dehydrogenase-like predicted oxidoreductase
MIDRAEFGRTGHQSSRVIFGAAALGTMGQEHADELLEVLAQFGVNHVDTAADYGDSELRLAPWFARHSGRFFLATKTSERTGDAARASLERSLTRLGVDHVDLVQLHNLVEEDEWEVAHARGGALDALVRARDEGLVRHIGVTGHGLRIAAMHRRSLERFDYDSVLLPYNYALFCDEGYRRESDALLATCAERQVAVQTIKSAARRRWAPDDPAPHYSWYEPLSDPGALGRSVRWVLGGGAYGGQLFVNSSSDARLLREILQAATDDATMPRPATEEMEADQRAEGVVPLFDGDVLERI